MTNAQLYEALYELQSILTERFTALERQNAAVHDRIGNVETAQQRHEESDHKAGASTTKLSGLAGLVAAIVAGIVVAIKQVFA